MSKPAGLTYTEIARRSKLSVSCVSRILSGSRSSARLESVLRIARAMRMQPWRLVSQLYKSGELADHYRSKPTPRVKAARAIRTR